MAETAGLVLAAIPIAVSVVEKYAVVSRLLERFRAYSDEARYVSQAINIQRSIHKNTLRILVGAVVGDDEADEMLSNPGHRLWQDERVVKGIEKRLGDSLEAFVDAAEAVKGKLGTLESFGLEWKGKRSDSKSGKESKRSFRSRIKFAFSEPRIDSLIATVSRLTQDMQTLIQQAECLYQWQPRKVPSVTTRKTIDEYDKIKRAAENLYNALSHACTVHNEHMARLSLQAVHIDPAQIQFTLAISSRLSAPNLLSSVCEPRFWLTVESVMSGTLQSTGFSRTVAGASTSNKRQRDRNSRSDLADALVMSSSRKAKTTRTIEPVTQVPASFQPVAEVEHSDPQPNFCKKQNFCAQLHKLATTLRMDKSPYVGYLELSDSSKHLVYLNSIAQVSATTSVSPMVTLRDLFKPEYQAKLSCYGLPPQNRVRIARRLAEAILQFQATPWLGDSWSSTRVLMFKSDESVLSTDAGNSDLFLNASIRKSFESPTLSDQPPSRSHVRNQLLFSLGVMMLELAFQKPLAELRGFQDIDQHESLNTDYFTADRIRREVSAFMGPRYAEAARKCIHCDFGSGSDLNKVELQQCFYEGVVCELERIEKVFSEFKMGI